MTVEPLPAKIEKNGITLTLEGFKSNKDAFFYSMEFDSYQTAVEHYKNVAKDGTPGEKTVLLLINGAVNFRSRNRASAILANLIDDPDKYEEEKTIGGGRLLVIDADSALSFLPGERGEADSATALQRACKSLLAEAIKAKEAGDLPRAKELGIQYKERHLELVAKEDELRKLREAEALAALEGLE